MCTIIQRKSRVRTNAPTLAGMIDTFKAPGGKIGIDACVSPAVFAKLDRHGMVYMVQAETGGMVAFESHMLPAVAAPMLEQARRAGVAVRH